MEYLDIEELRKEHGEYREKHGENPVTLVEKEILRGHVYSIIKKVTSHNPDLKEFDRKRNRFSIFHKFLNGKDHINFRGYTIHFDYPYVTIKHIKSRQVYKGNYWHANKDNIVECIEKTNKYETIGDIKRDYNIY